MMQQYLACLTDQPVSGVSRVLVSLERFERASHALMLVHQRPDLPSRDVAVEQRIVRGFRVESLHRVKDQAEGHSLVSESRGT
jgi:hypothetical protein